MSFVGSIVIVNFNSGAFLCRALASIAEHAPEAQVVVVDNASTDGSERAAECRRSHLTLARNDRNVGFARAVNQGLKLGVGDPVLLLNPDCRLTTGAVERLTAELTDHAGCAVAAPQILDEGGTVQANARGDPTLLTGLFGRTCLLTRLFPTSPLARRNVRTDLIHLDSPAAADVDWVSGACMMARRKALEEIHGFDERYFLYWEDADLCRRLRDRGRTIRYVPDARVVHTEGRSSGSARELAIRAFHRSAYTYYVSHVARGVVRPMLAWLVLQARCRWKLARFTATFRTARDRQARRDHGQGQVRWPASRSELR